MAGSAERVGVWVENPEGGADRSADQPRQELLSSREWLARVRENDPAASVSVPALAAPTRRFTWGVRAAIVLAVVFYGGLVVVNLHDRDRDLLSVTVVLLALAVVVAVVAVVEAWRWAGRPRFSTAPSGPLDAGLTPETKRAVRRMARGRGPDVAELRPPAAAYARSQQQSMGLSPAFLAVVTLSSLSQSGGGTIGLVLGAVLLLLNVGGLGWGLWMGHRARVIDAHLHISPDQTDPPERPE